MASCGQQRRRRRPPGFGRSSYDEVVSGAQRAFDSLLRDRVAPFLRADGFRKQRQTFWIRGDGTWGVVNFQKSAWNSADEVTFYVNVAIGSDRLMPGRAGRSGPPPEYECAIRTRLGNLLPEEGPPSWTLRHWADVDAVTESLESALAEAAIPYLRRFANDDAILDYWTELLDRGEPSTPLMPLPDVVNLASAIGRTELAARAQRIIDSFPKRRDDEPTLVVIESIEDFHSRHR